MSHPSWVCGLKLVVFFIISGMFNVTPFVGVWIETRQVGYQTDLRVGHTLRGCVD